MKDVVDLIDGREADELRELQRRLVSRIQELNETNKKNVDLIRSTLELINASIAYVSGFLHSNLGYSRDGQHAASGPQITAIVDRQA